MVSIEVELSLPLSDDEDVNAFFSEEREMAKSCLNKMKEKITRSDPFWGKYAPRFRKEWIDYWYYYGPEPMIPGEVFKTPDSITEELASNAFTSEDRSFAEQSQQQGHYFHGFMREKLKVLMGDDWYTRLDRDFHVLRDIEKDKIRYEYHTGTLDLDRYNFSDDEKHILQNSPETAVQHFAWDEL